MYLDGKPGTKGHFLQKNKTYPHVSHKNVMRRDADNFLQIKAGYLEIVYGVRIIICLSQVKFH